MDYGEFRAAHQEVQDKVMAAQLTPKDLKAELARLVDLRDGIADDLDRLEADNDLEPMRELLDMAESLPARPVSEAQAEAMAVAADALKDDGTPRQQVRRLQKGMKQIQRIARKVDDPGEQTVVLQQTEPLRRTLEALQSPDRGLER